MTSRVAAGAPDWRRWGPAAVAAAAAVMAATSFRHGQDFGVYWRAGGRILGGAPLYPPSDALPYRYAPGAALLFSPLAVLPAWIAKTIWYALNVSLCAWVARTLPRRVPAARSGVAVLLAFVALSRPFLEEFAAAQVDVLVLVLLLLAFEAEDGRREIGAGFLVAAAVALKLAPALVAADWALRKRWRALGALAGGLAIVAVAPLPFYGWRGTVAQHRAWIASIGGATTDMIAHPGNQSVFAIAMRLGLPAAAGAAAAAFLVGVALSSRAPEPRRSLLLFCLALSSSYGWAQNFVLAWPAVFLLAVASRSGGHIAVALGAPALFLLYDVVGRDRERWAFDHSLIGIAMLVLFALTARTARTIPAAAAAE